jgi:hypothetical protein
MASKRVDETKNNRIDIDNNRAQKKYGIPSKNPNYLTTLSNAIILG